MCEILIQFNKKMQRQIIPIVIFKKKYKKKILYIFMLRVTASKSLHKCIKNI